MAKRKKGVRTTIINKIIGHIIFDYDVITIRKYDTIDADCFVVGCNKKEILFELYDKDYHILSKDEEIDKSVAYEATYTETIKNIIKTIKEYYGFV